MIKKLSHDFFQQKNTCDIARALLGKVLVYNSPQGLLKGVINETEAYSEEEPACHAYGGRRSKRNEVMFWRAGHLYVYFTYGMYYCINIVTAAEGRAEAVLIRSVLPVEGEDIMLQNRQGKKQHLCDGPAKLAMAFGFDKKHNGYDLLRPDAEIYLEDHGIKPEKIHTGSRIGISKAQDLPWRFFCLQWHRDLK